MVVKNPLKKGMRPNDFIAFFLKNQPPKNYVPLNFPGEIGQIQSCG